MVRALLLVVLAALAAPAAAQWAAPADSVRPILDDIIEYIGDGGARDTLGVRIYADSTVAFFPYGRDDTVYVDYLTAIYMGLAVDATINLNEIDTPVISAEVIDGQVHVLIGRAIPLPVALAVAIVVPLLVLALIVYLARRLRQEKHQRRLLEEAGRQIAASREDERRRIARDLHDGPLQDLHALHMQLGLAVDSLSQIEGAGTASRRVRGSQDDAHTAIGEIRGIMEALRPPAIGPFGLAAALRSHAERFHRRFPEIRLDLDLDDDGLSLPETTRLVLFRVAQEAMSNAAKHARPTTVGVSLRLSDTETSLSVTDDGTGITGSPDTRALAAEGHFGFLGMQERASSIGGELSIDGRAGSGTRVTIRVPRR